MAAGAIVLAVAGVHGQPTALQPGQKIWDFVVEGGTYAVSALALGLDGTLYFGGDVDNKVHALDIATGRKEWEFTTGGNVMSAPVIGTDGTVYIGSVDKKIYALDGATGKRKWEFVTDGFVRTPAALSARNVVYINSADGKLYALDGATGLRLWTFPTGWESSGPVVGTDGTVYVASYDSGAGKVLALDGCTGTKKWVFDSPGPFNSVLALGAGDMVFVESGAAFYALDGATGGKKWELAHNNTVTYSAIVGIDRTVYFGAPRSLSSTESRLYALDGATGSKRWEMTFSSPFYPAAVAEDGTIYVAGRRSILALEGGTGARKWEIQTEEQPTEPPRLLLDANGVVYVPTFSSVARRRMISAFQGTSGLAASSWPRPGRDTRNSSSMERVRAPVILSQPISQSAAVGASASFGVNATGTCPLHYQWRFNGQMILGGTNSTLTLTNLQPTNAGTYTVEVSNAGGLVISEPALLKVTEPLLQPGSLDPTFNIGDGANDTVRAIAVQGDGKVLIGGQFTQVNRVPRSRIARLNADGTLDMSFNPGSGADREIRALALQPDGKILIAGDFNWFNGVERFGGIARLNPDGSLDKTFNLVNGDGRPLFPGAFSSNHPGQVIAVQTDGKVLVSGYLTGNFQSGLTTQLIRLKSDGSLDNSFNPSFDGTVQTLAFQADGKVIVGGRFRKANGALHSGITRLNADGTLDLTFNPRVGGAIPWVFAAAIQTDGKVLIGGRFTSVDGVAGNYIARLNTNGSLDTSFDPNLANPAAVRPDELDLQANGPVAAVASLASGKVLIGGFFKGDRNRVAVLHSNGSLDRGFDPGSGPDDAVLSIAVRSDGKIVVVGSFTHINGVPRNRVALLIGEKPAPTDSQAQGAVVAWGDNTLGQVSVPPGLRVVVAIAAGNQHSLALRSDGTVVGWGDNTLGQSAIPSGLSNVMSISAGAFHSLALKKDGTVVAWGEPRFGKNIVPGGLKDVTAVSAGAQHNLALKKDGTVIVWGDNSSGQATPPLGLSGIIAIAAGGFHNLALRQDGTVVAWGENRVGQSTVPVTGVMDIAAGFNHSLALKSDGAVVGWGANFADQISVPPGLRNVVAIAAGFSHSLALKDDGTVVAWGENAYGQAKTPADLKDVVAISAGWNHSLALIGGRSPPVIETQPQSQSVSAGGSVTLTVVGQGSGSLSYRWLFNSQPLGSATQPALVLQNATPTQAGNYSVVISNAFGSVSSTVAKLSVLNPLASSAIVTTLAGSGVAGYFDSQGRSAQFNQPNDCFVTSDGIITVADAFNHRIRRVTATGQVSTWAGTGLAGFLDGPGDNAQLNLPLSVFVGAGGDIFVADTENNRIRKISPAAFRTVATVAGSGVPGYADGPATSAKFNFPNDLVMDAAGNLYVTEFNNHTVRKITPSGQVSTFVGDGRAGSVNGVGPKARLSQPGGIAIDRQGNLYVSEWGNQRIRRIAPAGAVTTFAGSGGAGFKDGPAASATFNHPDDLAVDQSGNVFVADNDNHAIRKISPVGVVTTVAGSGERGYRDGSGAEAQFFGPGGLGLDPSGHLIVADTGNHRLRKITFLGLPKVTSEPQSQSVLAGGTVTLAVAASGEGPLTYQWRANQTTIGGATNSTLTLTNVQTNQAGHYTVLVNNPAGTVSSAVATLTVLGRAGFVTRILPAGYVPGVKLTVVLEATPLPGTGVYAVEDVPPSGWTVGLISEGGSFDVQNGKVKYGPFFDAVARKLSYEVTPPPWERGPKQFNGIASAEGQSSLVGGMSTLDLAPPLHPADHNPPDNRLIIDEVTAYGTAWRKGLIWPTPPNPIPIDYVTRAGALWRNGERYTFDPNASQAPLWWVNVSQPRPAALPRAASGGAFPLQNAAVSSLPPYFVPTEAFTVRTTVTVATGVAVYAVEERIPAGWTVSDLSHNGEFDAVNSQVKWGPFFDNTARQLSFQVSPPATSDERVTFAGLASFDGVNLPISGQRTTRASSSLSKLKRLADGSIEVTLRGRLGASFEIQVSTNLLEWSRLQAGTNSKGVIVLRDTAPVPGQRFYRAVSP
ncbi:MAG: PQQ-binding-like beta-propeller repeat protein [Verrucomicrobia bacterium]|nr:PQQ-binding-like beta-propeller repeat protein [Verrucomicrobiota bacterium]